MLNFGRYSDALHRPGLPQELLNKARTKVRARKVLIGEVSLKASAI
jgi:hypothetical protein